MKNGKDFLDNFKFVLSQVFLDDDQDINWIKFQIIYEKLFQEYL